MNIWKRASIRKATLFFIVGASFIAGAIFVGDEAMRNLDAITAWSNTHKFTAILIFILLYVVFHSPFFPDTLLGIFAGVIFGFHYGLIAVVCGSFLAALLQYALSLHLLKPIVDRTLTKKPTLVAVQTAVLKDELKLQLLIRLTPVNRALTSYLLGASGVRIKSFIIACVAVLPNLCLEVYFGYAGKHLVQSTEQTDKSDVLQNAVMIVGLIVAVVVMILVTRIARRSLDNVTAEVNKTTI